MHLLLGAKRPLSRKLNSIQKFGLILGLLMELCVTAANDDCQQNWVWAWSIIPQGTVTAPAAGPYKVGQQVNISAHDQWDAGEIAYVDVNGCILTNRGTQAISPNPTRYWRTRYGNEPVSPRQGSGLNASFIASSPCDVTVIFCSSNYSAAANPPQGYEASTSVTVSACDLTHETLEPCPGESTNRTILGVGEKVLVGVQPGLPDLNWSLEGPGELSTLVGNPTLFTAADETGEATVTASGGGLSFSVTFGVLQPGALTVVGVSNEIYKCTGSIPPTSFYVGYHARIYVLPDVVNFSAISLFEGYAAPVTTRYLTNFSFVVHETNGPHSVACCPIPGKGTAMVPLDQVGIAVGSVGTNVTNGSVNWSLPWSYKVADSPLRPIEVINQTGALKITSAVSKWTVTKGQSGAYIDTAEVRARWLYPPEP